MIIFEKKYSGESIYDVSQDLADAFDSSYNPAINDIPVDEYGFQSGTFTIKIEWDLKE